MTVWGEYEPLDHVVLAGVVSPGICRITGHEREQGWDVQEADGQKGAATVHKGPKVASFTVTFHLLVDDVLETDSIAEWDAFQRLIESTVVGEERRALDIYHPDLARLGIGAVVYQKLGGMIHDGFGGASVDVQFIEYFAPAPKPAKKTGGAKKKSKDGGDAGGPDPNDPITIAANQLNSLVDDVME
jgi:hypothetical protein